jgi:hypothetical protein
MNFRTNSKSKRKLLFFIKQGYYIKIFIAFINYAELDNYYEKLNTWRFKFESGRLI